MVIEFYTLWQNINWRLDMVQINCLCPAIKWITKLDRIQHRYVRGNSSLDEKHLQTADNIWAKIVFRLACWWLALGNVNENTWEYEIKLKVCNLQMSYSTCHSLTFPKSIPWQVFVIFYWRAYRGIIIFKTSMRKDN